MSVIYAALTIRLGLSGVSLTANHLVLSNAVSAPACEPEQF